MLLPFCCWILSLGDFLKIQQHRERERTSKTIKKLGQDLSGGERAEMVLRQRSAAGHDGGVRRKALRKWSGVERRGRRVVRAACVVRPRVAIAGVTGAVGQEFLQVLEERNFPYAEMKMLASARSAGQKVDFDGKEYTVEELNEASFKDVDIALFSAGGSISKKFAPAAVDAGAIVIDNSSAFRMDPECPLVIPEVNGAAATERFSLNDKGAGGIIANPNCSTILCLMAVTPLHRQKVVKRMVVSTYQAASGAGAAAMQELETQTKEVLAGEPPTTTIFGRQYAFNIFSHNSGVDMETGYNEEEMKMVKETRKIWGNDDVRVTATCIRVPVMRAHAESINLELEHPVTIEEAKTFLEDFPGVSVIDDRAANEFPTPLQASFKDDIYVGRLRHDVSQEGNKGLDLFICGDQIRKGAALNAVQIAELLVDAAS